MPSPLIIPSVTPGVTPVATTGTLFRDYAIDLGEELGFLAQVNVSSAASNVEAARTLIVDELRDDEYDAGELGGWWVYVLSGAYAGQQRRILRRGHYGHEAALMLSRPFAGALAQGTQLIVTHPLPFAKNMAIDGLKTLVNKALNRIMIEGRISFTGNNSDTHNLGTYPWLRSVAQFTGLYDRLANVSASNAQQLSGQGFRVQLDGVSASLITNNIYGTSVPFAAGVIVQADRLIYDGSAWGYASTPGLVNDTDEAVPPREWVRAIGMVKALQVLIRAIQVNPRLSKEAKGEMLSIIDNRRPTYAHAAAKIVTTQFPRPMQQPHDALVGEAWADTTYYSSTESVGY